MIVPLNTNMDFPLERSLEDCLKAVEVKSLSRYFDDQLDAAEELYGIQLHFNFNTNRCKGAHRQLSNRIQPRDM